MFRLFVNMFVYQAINTKSQCSRVIIINRKQEKVEEEQEQEQDKNE